MRSKASVGLKERVASRHHRKECVLLKSHTVQRLRASPTLRREDVAVEYPEFHRHIDELMELLRKGVEVHPVTPKGNIFSIVGPIHDFWIQPYVGKNSSQEVVKVHILGCSRKLSKPAMREKQHAAARSNKTAR
jgi:hypothetical protein